MFDVTWRGWMAASERPNRDVMRCYETPLTRKSPVACVSPNVTSNVPP
jgi:hypothetical protein